MKYLITISITIITGTLIFVLQEVIKSYVIKPKTEYEELKSKISFLLIYYAGVIHNPRSSVSDDESQLEMYKNAETQFREVASKLMSFSGKSHRFIKSIPHNDILYEASKQLIGLSNGVYKEDTDDNARKNNIQYENKLKKILNINIR